jgi:uncharacterized protein HemX
VRRHPTTAAAYGLLLLALVLGLGGGGSVWLWLTAERAHQEAEAARQQAEEATRQATRARDQLAKEQRQTEAALVREREAKEGEASARRRERGGWSGPQVPRGGLAEWSMKSFVGTGLDVRPAACRPG